MNRNQRTRIGLRDQARHRVRVATRWAAVAGGALAAAFAVVLSHYDATAAPHSSTTPTVTPAGTATGDSGQNSGLPLQPPAQPPMVGFGNYGNYGSSGGS